MREMVILSYDEMAAICPRVPDDGRGDGLEAAIRRHLAYLLKHRNEALANADEALASADKWSPHIGRALAALIRIEPSVAK